MSRTLLSRLGAAGLAFLAAAALAFAAPAEAHAQAVTVFFDDFQSTTGLNTTNWTNVSGNYSGNQNANGYRNGTYNGQPNGYASFFPSYSLYFRSNNQRRAQMQTLNLSARGALLTFDLRYQGSGQTGLPFDEYNTSGEEIVVEYSTNPTAGNPTWTQVARFAWNSTTYNSWTMATVYLPSAAWTTTTAIRFRQLNHSGASYDNWAIDNVRVVVNPEPGTWALFGFGVLSLAGVAARRRRRRRSASSVAPVTVSTPRAP